MSLVLIHVMTIRSTLHHKNHEEDNTLRLIEQSRTINNPWKGWIGRSINDTATGRHQGVSMVIASQAGASVQET